MLNFFFVKKILFFLFILSINLILSDYVSIPFKIYHYSVNKPNAIDKFINEYILNNICIPMQISQPPQKIIAKINSLEFELLMKNVNKPPFDKLYSNFTKEISTTFSIISEKGNSHFPNSKYVKDNFNFCTNYDLDNKKCLSYNFFNNINFIFTEWDNFEEKTKTDEKMYTYTYIEIGLNLKSQYPRDEMLYSLSDNLIKNNYINNNNWFLYFFNKIHDNINDNVKKDDEGDDGIIVFGNDPIDFFGNKYNKDNIASCQGINKDYDYKNTWSLIFQEVKQKTLKPDNKDVIIGNNLQGVINYNYNILVGNNHYLDIIERTFFLTYTTQGICEKKLANNKFYYFVCKSLLLNINEIKVNFPSLYFKQKELNFTFELVPEDLFVQIGDQIFFLVVFNKNNPTPSFLLGNIFLQKYFFSFDNKSKKILFYNENKNKEAPHIENDKEENVLHWYNSPKILVIMSFLIVIFSIFGFYSGKRIYNRRKLKANELDDNFEYTSPKEIKKYDLEMAFKI